MLKKQVVMLICVLGVCSVVFGDLLDDASKAFGSHEDFRIVRVDHGEAVIETPTVSVRLYAGNRNYTLKAFGVPGNLVDWTATLSWNDVKDASEMYGGPHVKAVMFTRRDGGVTMEAVMDSSHLHVVRTYEFYDNAPYIRVHYDVEAVKDAFCPRQLVNVGISRQMRMLAYFDGTSVRYYTNRRNKVDWFNIERPDDVPCVVYLPEGGRGGYALFCPDVSLWKRHPGKMLCSAGEKGGFTLELNRWARRDVRVGDSLYYDFFLSPVEDFNDARRMLFRMMGR